MGPMPYPEDPPRPSEPLPPARGLLLRAVGTLTRRPGPAPALDGQIHRYAAPPLDPAWLARYHAYFGGFRAEVPLPALYPLAQRAQLARMVASGFPYPVVGMVHLANDQRLVEALDPAAGFVLEVAAAPGAWPGAPDWDCVTFEVTYLQADRPRATCRSVYLARRRGRRTGEREDPAPDATPFLAERWALPADEGRRYAALSGDHNPIHLSPWLSRGFGFPRPILHGMDGVGRAAAAIERGLGRPLAMIRADFGKAVALPSQVALTAWQDAPDRGGFSVKSTDGATRHVGGAFEA